MQELIEQLRNVLYESLADRDFQKSANSAKFSELIGAAIVQLAQFEAYRTRMK